MNAPGIDTSGQIAIMGELSGDLSSETTTLEETLATILSASKCFFHEVTVVSITGAFFGHDGCCARPPR